MSWPVTALACLAVVAAFAFPVRAADVDACTLIKAEEVSKIFGARTFTVDTSNPMRSMPGGPRRNAVSSCTFTLAGPTPRDMIVVSLTLTTAPSDRALASIERMKAGVALLSPPVKTTDVTGLGDGAFWFNPGSERRTAVTLNVKHNPRHWLAVGESSAGQPVEKTLERLKAVARLALARL